VLSDLLKSRRKESFQYTVITTLSIVITSYRGIMSSVSLKCSDLIKQLNGDGDFSVWIAKLELVAKLQKVDNLENFLPLFLFGGAFAVYKSLSETVRGDYGKLKEALMRAFTVNQFRAYEEFMGRTLRIGEAVDVYLSDLQRLADLVSKTHDEEWIKCALVNGLPVDVKTQLTAACTLENMSLQEITQRARALINSGDAVSGLSSLAIKHLPAKPRVIKCFFCQEEGHFSSRCPRKGASTNSRTLRCYNCDEIGHMASACPKKDQKTIKEACLLLCGRLSLQCSATTLFKYFS
jgi:hypothetical protein